MPNFRIYPYKMGSQSAKKLSTALSSLRVYPDRGYRPRSNHVIINWGSSRIPNWYSSNVTWRKHYNDVSAVALAANKLETFRCFLDNGVKHPDITCLKETAENWIEEGYKVICRTVLNGHSGQGIVIASSVDELVDAPLYTKFVPKDKEYRVHVFEGEVIDFQQKKKKQGFEGGLAGIRNYANGWVYARSDISLPDSVASESIKAVAALGLDFGAVDVCTGRDGKVYVFEVNTAPGLEGTTLTKYVEAFQRVQA